MLSWEEAVAWLRDQSDKQELVRACFFDDPLASAARRYYASTEWKAVREILAPVSGTVLDLGAGRGISSYALARDGWNVTALEPDPSPLVGSAAIRALAEEEGLDIKVVETWGESLPLEDKTFDVVHCRQVLHHARNLHEFCSEVARVLKTGGTFIATREHVISRREDLPAFLAQHPLHKLYGGENAFLLREYIDAIRQSGIEIVSILNSYQSDINLYPDTVDGLRVRVAQKVGLPVQLIPKISLQWLAALSDAPGRLYTIVGRR